jgi:hypothetical protein
MQFLNILLSLKATDPPYLAPFPLNLQSIHLSIVEKLFNKIAPPTPPVFEALTLLFINLHSMHCKDDLLFK